MAAAPVASVISETSHPTLSLVDSSSVSSKPCPVPLVSTDRFIDRFGERTAMSTILLLHPSPRSLFPPPPPPRYVPLQRFAHEKVDRSVRHAPSVLILRKAQCKFPWLQHMEARRSWRALGRATRGHPACQRTEEVAGACLCICPGRGAFWAAMGRWNVSGSRIVAPGLKQCSAAGSSSSPSSRK